jgi:hypothetical protein
MTTIPALPDLCPQEKRDRPSARVLQQLPSRKSVNAQGHVRGQRNPEVAQDILGQDRFPDLGLEAGGETGGDTLSPDHDPGALTVDADPDTPGAEAGPDQAAMKDEEVITEATADHPCPVEEGILETGRIPKPENVLAFLA